LKPLEHGRRTWPVARSNTYAHTGSQTHSLAHSLAHALTHQHSNSPSRSHAHVCTTSLNRQVLDLMAAEGPGRAFAFAGSLDATLRTGDPDGVKAAVRSLGQAARARGVFAGRLCGGGIDSFGVSFCFSLLCALSIRKIVMVACSTCGLDSVLCCVYFMTASSKLTPNRLPLACRKHFTLRRSQTSLRLPTTCLRRWRVDTL
jgi:hypothetical protein